MRHSIMPRACLVAILLLALACADGSGADVRTCGPGNILVSAGYARTLSGPAITATYGGPVRIPVNTMGMIVAGGRLPNTVDVMWDAGFVLRPIAPHPLFTPRCVIESTVPLSALEQLIIAE